MAKFAAINQKYTLEMQLDSVPELCRRFGLTFPGATLPRKVCCSPCSVATPILHWTGAAVITRSKLLSTHVASPRACLCQVSFAGRGGGASVRL